MPSFTVFMLVEKQGSSVTLPLWHSIAAVRRFPAFVNLGSRQGRLPDLRVDDSRGGAR